MTETTPSGWSITARRNDGRPTWRLTAISPDRQRVIRLDKVLEEDLASFNPERRWADR